MGGEQSKQQETQTNQQTNKNIQISDDEVKNYNKEQNIQDYATYIRMSNRNVNNLSTNVKNNLKAMAEANQRNSAVISGCVDFKKQLEIIQENKLDQKVDKMFEELAKDITKLKNSSKNESDTTTTGDQSAGSTQSGATNTTQGSDQAASDEQKAKQDKSSFTLLSQMNSPLNFSKSVNSLINERYTLTTRKPVKHDPNFHAWFHDAIWKRSTNYKKEGLCFFLCFDSQTSDQENIQYNENRQESKKLLENNNDIYNKISTAYDKLSEMYNETKKDTNIDVSDDSGASASQTNEFIVDGGKGDNPCAAVFEGEVTVDQKNVLSQTVVVNNVIDVLSSADIENESQAIMADMMGLTQAAASDQAASATSDQQSKQDLDNKQTTEQSMSSKYIWIALCVIAAIAAIGGLIWFLQQNKGSGDEDLPPAGEEGEEAEPTEEGENSA